MFTHQNHSSISFHRTNIPVSSANYMLQFIEFILEYMPFVIRANLPREINKPRPQIVGRKEMEDN